jgi:hypothetical protein
MPPATPDGPLAAALAGLTADLPSSDAVTVEVVGLTPRHCDPERLLSRAKVSVLITASAAPAHVVDALLACRPRPRTRSTRSLSRPGGPLWAVHRKPRSWSAST